MANQVMSGLGFVVMLFLAWLLSNDRKAMNWRLILMGIFLQFLFGILVIQTRPGKWIFSGAREVINQIISFSDQGAKMVFGASFQEHYFAFVVLPIIIFISSVMAVLFFLGWVQKLVGVMAWVMHRLMRTSGSESLTASANIFVGQTEAPLVVKPYIASMTKSELMTMMIAGMSTAAGSTLAAYVSFGADAGHLLAASVMSAIASLVLAKIIYPEREESVTQKHLRIAIKIDDENVFDAACRGASEGLRLAVNVAAMVIAFVAIAAMLNYLLSLGPSVNGEPLSFQRVLGWLFSPLAFFIGVTPADVFSVGSLLGTKMFLNEFIAFMDLQNLKSSIDPRSFTLATYALCGFANFSSIAIQIGGIGSLVPERRKDLARFGFKAMLGGTLAANMSACVAGILIP